MVVKQLMMINHCGTVGRTQTELTEILRSRPDLDLTGVSCIDPGSHNQAIKQLYSDLNTLNEWFECENSEQFHQMAQSHWRMPAEYQDKDIVKLLLDQCDNEAELQRMAQELLMFQDLELIDLLRYLHYMVETLLHNKIVLGVGRGSSVASFALYKLGVHRVNSLYWDLDIHEFLK